VRESGSRAARGSVVAGLASVATLPLAVYLTRFSGGYELLDASFAIPLAAALGIAALLLARRARKQAALSLVSAGGRSRAATAGRVLGIAGLCLAASALVALGVYGLLEYVGSRD
jgi:hypothetical protein